MSSASTSPPVTARRFTRDEYDRMVAIGLFHPGERLELIEGQIVEMTPQGSRHSTAVLLAEKALAATFGPGFLVRVQMPLALDEHSEPEPDLAVVSGEIRDYRDAHPSRPRLVVEVADSTLALDRGRKLALYARCGVPEVWIVNLTEAMVEVYRDPSGPAYRSRLELTAGGSVAPVAAGGALVQVNDLLP